MKKRSVVLLTVFLSVALLCPPEMKLHIHNFKHNHVSQHENILSEGFIEHSHVSKAHLSVDNTHLDQHNAVMSEVDISPDGLLKKMSGDVFTLFLLVSVLVLLLLSSYQYIFQFRRNDKPYFSSRFLKSPPLRAPPF